MVRMRYNKVKDKEGALVLVSNTVMGTHELMFAVIFPKACTGYIHSDHTKPKLIQATTIVTLKKKIKDELKQQGVLFYDSVPRRKKK